MSIDTLAVGLTISMSIDTPAPTSGVEGSAGSPPFFYELIS
jgi:hypothetical protein